jgi:hypothetical protein
MPLKISAIYPYASSAGNILEVFLAVSGATAGNQLVSASCAGSSIATPKIVTSGFSSAASSGTALIPTEFHTSYTSVELNSNLGLVETFEVRDISTGEVARSTGTSASIFVDTGTWTVTQDASKNINISCTSLGSSTSCPIFVPLANSSSAVNVGIPPQIWQIDILNQESSILATQNLRPPLNGTLPFAQFDSSVITANGDYFTKIRRKISTIAGGPSGNLADEVVLIIPSTLTASAVTSGGSSNMFSWLDNSYWYLTDLQVNLGTRAVTHRHGTIQIRPSDTINFAILFHDGTAGINPQATDIKLAVRSSNNTSPYHFWSAATVSTVTISGDVYYAITVTASDDDLLTAQAANLLAGSNASQSLLGEIQWTTTRGTFSSDTFTINVPSEVVREPDV